MSTTINNKEQLFALMKAGATVITPNNRLAEQLLHDYLSMQGETVQEKPACLPYRAFLHQSFKTLGHRTPRIHHPLLLTTQQTRFLWQQIIGEHLNTPAHPGLLHEIQDSWSRCLLWEIDSRHPSFSLTDQTRRFQVLWQQTEKRLNSLHAITTDQLLPYLLAQQDWTFPETMIWACFDDFTPQQHALQQATKERGARHFLMDLQQPVSRPFLYAAKDERDEYQQLIHWLYYHLEQKKQRIGVIIPELHQQAHHIHRMLSEHFSPESFNLSLGQSLKDYPLVAHALCWLALDTKTITQHQAGLLLRSPFLGHSRTEMLARAHFLQNNRTMQERNIDVSLLARELQKTAPELSTLLTSLYHYPESASPQSWTHHFYKRLAELGFAGEYPLNSASYQCYQRFLLLFDEFKQLSLLTDTMTFEQALSALNDMAQHAIFQPRKSPAPIQIMGLLESAGSQFDCLWVSGLTDDCLPQNTRLSAFIPITLQQELEMPHASPARELRLAQKTLNRLQYAGSECVFSYPCLTKDKPNLPSPLLVDIPEWEARHVADYSTHSTCLVRYNEEYQLPVQDYESPGGGTNILANQAKCPFRAFAAHRLHVKTGMSVSDGPNPQERGKIIHKIMEVIWRRLHDQQTLLTMDEKTLDAIIEQAIIDAIEPYQESRPHSFSPWIQSVEIKRLKRLVYAALQWEKLRPSFVIDGLEQSFTLNLSGLELTIRIDRMDSLASGKKWVIDYKSSLPQSTPWNEDRPIEPQLLLYALLHDDINTLLFAQLKNGQIQCKGLSEEQSELSGITSLKNDQSWEECRTRWQQQLDDLAREFLNGYCPPKPAKPAICQQCDFKPLCRFSVSTEDS
ncbi:PD-(D/E)XK nuclease family protein [Legionella spiritensis]|uniref:PD-(D/E)XK nuclease family protein n=1 Tax=Legionella spiritensis TaxID=452 RepID=UPI000F6E4416|nr:PD-(D/E)XK nuclease family protein [Legionella spiritensis]VEG90717.1 recombinase B [Legionella spiritensis]